MHHRNAVLILDSYESSKNSLNICDTLYWKQKIYRKSFYYFLGILSGAMQQCWTSWMIDRAKVFTYHFCWCFLLHALNSSDLNVERFFVKWIGLLEKFSLFFYPVKWHLFYLKKEKKSCISLWTSFMCVWASVCVSTCPQSSVLLSLWMHETFIRHLTYIFMFRLK